MFRLVTTLCFLAVSHTARSATFQVESAVNHALRHNRELAAARFSVDEARGRLLQAGRLSNPELESEWKPNVRGREYSVGLGFVQKFPLTSRLRIEKAVTRAQLAAAEAEVGEAARKLAGEVRAAAVKMLALKLQKALKAEQIANGTEMVGIAGKAVAAGEGSTLDVTQFELEVGQLRVELLQFEAEEAALAGELRPLLGLNATDRIEITGSLADPAAPRRVTPDLAERPDYRAALAKAEAARQNVQLERKNRWEDAGVGLAAEIERAEDAPEGFENDGFIGLMFSLPLPLWNGNEGKILEAEAAASRTEAEAHALAARIRAEAAAARDEAAAAAKVFAEVSGTLLPKARNLEERVLGLYRTAQPGATFTDVLRSREKRLLLEGVRLNALRDFHLARARLRTAMGGSNF